MPDPEKKEIQEPECDPDRGKCIKDHPLHCCHIAHTVWQRSMIRGCFLVGWVCEYCGKTSETWTLVRG